MRQFDILHAFARTFLIAYPNPVWLVFSLSSVILLAPVLWLFGFSAKAPDQSDALYILLGSLPATLGTVFVLAFTFTFVAAQIASNYNRVLFNRVLGPWALWYAIPFGTGILLPLFLLNGHFFLWSVQISLLLATFCIVSLVPFAVAVRGLLSVSEAIQEKKKQILAATDEKATRDLVTELGNITIGALALKDFATFELGVGQLVETSRISTRISVRSQICNEVRRMILRNIDERFASETLMSAMTTIGLEHQIDQDIAIEQSILEQVTDAYRTVHCGILRHQNHEILLIARLAHLAAEQGHTNVLLECQMMLYVICERTITEFSIESESARAAIENLGNIVEIQTCCSLSRDDHDRCVTSAVMSIEFLGIKAQELEREDLKDLALVQLQRLKRGNLNISENTRRYVQAAAIRLRNC